MGDNACIVKVVLERHFYSAYVRYTALSKNSGKMVG